ncbi:trehalose-phosphatase [Microbacterium sp. 69-10]|uniref:trehalose-phosphatase n=1 Tax=Microbacterium sp. 69-10 TaxID=1895783 RepID=UPI0025DBDE47|nr:trehalose-phosphatase [Microbacterium sp. 69-10]
MTSEALRTLASTPRLLVALDFDGTVADFVDDPYSARVIPEAAEPIARLRDLNNTWVAFVSGRPLNSLARVTEADEHALLVGSHGAEARLGGGVVDLGLDDDERHRLFELAVSLAEVVDRTPGAVLEHKPFGYGVHTRNVAADAVPRMLADARHAAERIGGFLDRDGKDILEFAVRDTTKGDGVELLRQHLGATGVLFVGDDVTDEDGFAAMHAGDIGLKVGAGATAALYRVADPRGVAEVLRKLVEKRAALAVGQGA